MQLKNKQKAIGINRAGKHIEKKKKQKTPNPTTLPESN